MNLLRKCLTAAVSIGLLASAPAVAHEWGGHGGGWEHHGGGHFGTGLAIGAGIGALGGYAYGHERGYDRGYEHYHHYRYYNDGYNYYPRCPYGTYAVQSEYYPGDWACVYD